MIWTGILTNEKIIRFTYGVKFEIITVTPKIKIDNGALSQTLGIARISMSYSLPLGED